MNNKERIENFMKEYEELCVKYNLSLSHEDIQGTFIIDEYDKEDVNWVKSALNGFEIRERKAKEAEEIKERLTIKKRELAELLGGEEYSVDSEGNVVDNDCNVIRSASKKEKEVNSIVETLRRGFTWRQNTKY